MCRNVFLIELRGGVPLGDTAQLLSQYGPSGSLKSLALQPLASAIYLMVLHTLYHPTRLSAWRSRNET